MAWHPNVRSICVWKSNLEEGEALGKDAISFLGRQDTHEEHPVPRSKALGARRRAVRG